MHTTCPLHTHCCWISVISGLVWLLAASGLLFLTWNKVICHFFAKVKPAKYWQPLLVLVTIGFLCIPCALRHHRGGHHHGGGCGWGHCCHHKGDGDCPYASKGEGDDDDSAASAPAQNEKAPAKK